MESALNSDFSDVRVHEGSQAAALGATAFAQGTDLHFAPGAFDTSSRQGLSLIGHELTHVVQQRQGRVQADIQGKGLPINSDPALEHEADVLGAKAAGLEPGSPVLFEPTAAGTTGGPVQRKGAPVQRKVIQANRGTSRNATPTFKPKINDAKTLKSAYGVKDPKTSKIGLNGRSPIKPSPRKTTMLTDLSSLGGGTDEAQKLDSKTLNPGGEEATLDPKLEAGGPKDTGTQSVKPHGGDEAVEDLEAQGGDNTGKQDGTDKGGDAKSDKDAKKDEVDPKAAQAQREEEERQKLEAEVQSSIQGLQTSVSVLSNSLHNEDGLKQTLFKSVVDETVIPEVSSKLFIKAQEQAKKKILAEQGDALAAEFESALDARSQEQDIAGDAKGKAAKEWQALKAAKAKGDKDDPKKLQKLKAKGKDAMAAEIARKSVEDRLRSDFDAIRDITWTAGAKQWSRVVTEAEGHKGIDFVQLSREVGAMGPEVTTKPALEAKKADVEARSKAILDALEELKELVQANFATTAKNNMDKVTEKLKSKYDLGWFSSGSDADRGKIKQTASDKAADNGIVKQVAGQKVQAVLETNFPGLSGRLGRVLEAQVPNAGDFAELGVTLTIPLGSGFNLVLEFGGELEKDDEGTQIKMNGKIGASFGLENVFSIQASFGGYIEAKGKDAANALELMAYSFYMRGKDKLPNNWVNRIWGLGGRLDTNEAKKWAAFIEEKMEAGHYVESGVMAEVSGEVGNADSLGAKGTLSGKSGSRWSKEVTQDEKGNDVLGAVKREGVTGGKVELAGAFGPLSAKVAAELVRVSGAQNGPKVWEFTLEGEGSISTKALGDGVGKIVDVVIDVLDKANDKLSQKFVKDPEGRVALQTADDKKGLASVLLGKAREEGADTIGKAGGKMVGLKEDEEEEDLSALEDVELEGDETQFALDANDSITPTLEGLDEKQIEMQNQIKDGLKPINDAYEDAKNSASEKASEIGNGALDRIGIDEEKRKAAGELIQSGQERVEQVKEAAGFDDGETIGIGFELSRRTGEGWEGDLHLKKEKSIGLEFGIASVEAKKGHKYSLKNNVIAKAAEARKKKK